MPARVPRVTIGIARPARVLGVTTTPRVPRLGSSTLARAGGKAVTTSKRGGGNGKGTK